MFSAFFYFYPARLLYFFLMEDTNGTVLRIRYEFYWFRIENFYQSGFTAKDLSLTSPYKQNDGIKEKVYNKAAPGGRTWDDYS